MQRLKDCQIEGSSPLLVRYDAVLARVVEGHAGLSRVARGAFYARVRTKLIAEMRAEGRSDAIESELGVFDDAVERIEARILERGEPEAAPKGEAEAGGKVADDPGAGDKAAEAPNEREKSVEDLRRKVRAWTGRVVERGTDDDKGGIAALKPGPVEWTRSESRKSDVWLKDLLDRTQAAEAAEAQGRSSRPQLVRPVPPPQQLERPIPDRPVPERPMPQRPMTPKGAGEGRPSSGEDPAQGVSRSGPLSDGVKRRSATVVPTEFRRTRDSKASRGLEKSLMLGDRVSSQQRTEEAIRLGPIMSPGEGGEIEEEQGNSLLFYFGVAVATCIIVIMIAVGMMSVSRNARVQVAEPQTIQQTVVNPVPTAAGSPVPVMVSEEAPSTDDRAARAMLQRLEQWRPKTATGERWR